jgi:ABC-type glycerol-3-phosphate transport system permease component
MARPLVRGLLGYFKSVPRELEEAARIDGATRFQAMTRVELPLCTPGLRSAGIFAYTPAQNEFLYALIFSSKSEVRTVVLIDSFFVDYDEAGLTAGSVKNQRCGDGASGARLVARR